MPDEIIKEQENGNGLEDYDAPKVCIGCGTTKEVEKCDGTLCQFCWSAETNWGVEK